MPPTPASMTQQLGLSVKATTPLALVPGGGVALPDFDNQITQYSHVLSAYGGYDSATIEIVDHISALDDWYDYGLGRHIVCYDHAQQVIWEGFVNQISYGMGTLAKVRGPLLNLANRVKVEYTTRRWNTNPPIGGVSATTVFAENSASNALYGVWIEIVNGGEMDEGEALYERAQYLLVHSVPETGEDLNFADTAHPSITLNCMGYFHTLTRYDYELPLLTSYINNDGKIDADAKIRDVLAAHPNGFFSNDYSLLADNPTVTAPQWEDEARTADAIIKELVARGDGNGTRWLFGVTAGRRVYYNAAPARTAIEYQHYITERSQKVTDLAGVLVRPWNVLPGKWAVVPHYPQDVIFFEQVTFTAPYGLAVTGGKADPGVRRLERWGLGGVVA